VVPCYGYGRYLRECVDSVLSQDVEVSVLVIDDASPDDTQAVAWCLAAEDERVVYRRHVENRGHISTYNEGLDWARGTYTLLLSADDVLAPGALRRARDVLDGHPDVVMVHGQGVPFGETVPSPRPRARTDVWVQPGDEFLRQCCDHIANLISTPTVVVRTSVQHEVGGYRPELPHTGDLEMWLRLAARGRVAKISGSAQAYQRFHGRNMSSAFCQPLLADERQLRAAYDTFFDRCAASLPGRDELKRLCARRLAETGIRRGYRMLRRLRTADALTCLRFAVAAWHDRAEDEVRLMRIREVMSPLTHAVRERRRRRRAAGAPLPPLALRRATPVR
jgi:glycosyltransferase involved in cell wall biosynthesis